VNLLTVLLVVFVLIVLFGNPHVGGQLWGPAYSYGYWPSGIGLIVVIVLLVLLLR
jgi:hypothetical protein